MGPQQKTKAGRGERPGNQGVAASNITRRSSSPPVPYHQLGSADRISWSADPLSPSASPGAGRFIGTSGATTGSGRRPAGRRRAHPAVRCCRASILALRSEQPLTQGSLEKPCLDGVVVIVLADHRNTVITEQRPRS